MVIDTQRYLKEGLEELADSNVYVALEEDSSLATARTSNAILEKHCRQGMITQHTLDKYSTNPDNVRQQRMYFLRKVHKSPHQLRPIVSCCSGPTQKISQLANNLLKDYLNTVPSLITSSTQVIHAIEALSIPMEKRDSFLLATLDVKALYPSIPPRYRSYLRPPASHTHQPTHCQDTPSQKHAERNAATCPPGKHFRVCCQDI